MLDHILMFADESAALVALAPLGYCRDGGEAGWAWDLSRVLPGAEMVLADAVWDRSDPEHPLLISPRAVIDGFFVVISLPAEDAALKALPGNACRIIGDAQAAAQGQPFIAWTAPDLNPATLAGVLRVEPTLAGRNYDFASLGG